MSITLIVPNSKLTLVMLCTNIAIIRNMFNVVIILVTYVIYTENIRNETSEL